MFYFKQQLQQQQHQQQLPPEQQQHLFGQLQAPQWQMMAGRVSLSLNSLRIGQKRLTRSPQRMSGFKGYLQLRCDVLLLPSLVAF